MMGDVQNQAEDLAAGAGGPRDLIVMYHYIHETAPPAPSGVRPLLRSDFELQLDWLGDDYDILRPDDFVQTVKTPPLRRRPACLLTFDDGTADHAELVMPLLARRNLSGLFFILSGPALEGLMPLTHAIHWALSQGDSAVLAALADEAARAGVSLGDPRLAGQMYNYESRERAVIKYAANVALPSEVTQRALARLADGKLDDLARKWFVSVPQLQAMHAAGMILGVHGHTHRSLQQMGPTVKDEIAACATMLRKITGSRPKWWACPFGGTGASDSLRSLMHEAARAAGIEAGVSTEARLVAAGDSPLALPRIDCVNLPPIRKLKVAC